MMRSLAVMLVTMGLAAAAQAAAVTFTLTFANDGTFNIRGSSDGAGLAGYNIEIQNVNSFSHIAPAGVRADNFTPKGFSVGNANTTIPSPVTGINAIFAGQNTSAAGGTANQIYNYGVSASNEAAENIFGPSNPVDSWDANALIGSGTWNTSGPAPSFLSGTANVYDSTSGVTTTGAAVTLVVVPEPASLGLLGLASLCLVGLRRRSA